MTGQTISHYKILDKLGEGGMGVVYKAEDTKLKRTVALKFLAPLALGSEEEKTRFVHEAQAAATLDHPNICTVYEIDQAGGQTFIAMAYIDGKSLREMVSPPSRGDLGGCPLPIEDAANYAVQVAEGLQEAHEKGVVHRDVKSANLMVTPKGLVKILDFGLAKLTGRTQLTRTGTTLGTVATMSPEQLQGESVDRRSDIWSLGVVLYEMLTGRLPFKGEYEQAVAYSILNEDPEPITGLRTGVPMALERIVTKALAKNPQERYQHVDELLVDLRSVSRELEADQQKSAPTPTRLSRRHRVLLYGGIALLLLVLALVGRDLFTGGHETIDSIAVLPLKNYSGDPGQEYFSDGMTEELIDKLGRIAALRVISSTSVMRYKETDKSLPEIARELDVAAIVEGSVQPFGEQVRIRVRLIDARADEQLWNGSFERELRNVLTLQREVALAIAREVEVTLTPQDETRLAEAPEVNPEAYDLYIRGRQAQAKFWATPQATAYFGQAIAIDSSFAPAYAELAIEYAIKGGFNLLPGGEVKAKQLAEKALSLDPSLSESYIAIGLLRELVDWDWAGAEEAFRRAIDLNPGDAFAHMELGQLWLRLGRFEKALAMAKQALYLDPLSARYQTSVGAVYLYSGRYHQAVAELKKARESGSSNIGYLAVAYWWTSRYEEACRLLEGSEASILARPYAVICQRENALAVLEDMKARWAQGNGTPDNPWEFALIYASLGKKEQALDWLERAYEARLGVLVYIKVEPGFDSLHGEPRFQALLEKMGFPE